MGIRLSGVNIAKWRHVVVILAASNQEENDAYAMKTYPPSPREHIFFSAIASIMVTEVIVGFSSTYLPKVFRQEIELPGIIHFHAVVFTMWLAFFLFQVTLILRKKVALHTRLGNWGVLFSLIMLVVGFAAAIEAAKLNHKGIPGASFPDAEGFLLLNVSAILVFVVLTVLGWLNRKNPVAHKRFMLMANVGGIAPPGVARLPFVAGSTPGIAIAVMILVLAGPVYDLFRYRKIHWAYLTGFLIIIFSLPPIVLALSGTGAWRSIAELLMNR